MSEPGFAIRAEDQPAWAEIVRRAERGESAVVIAHGDHVADVVPSGELDRLRETIEVLSDTEQGFPGTGAVRGGAGPGPRRPFPAR